MKTQDRKAAQAAWRERKPDAGIYAVHAGGQLWVGAAPTLASVENRLRFTLQQGVHPNPALQAAAGQGGLRVEVLETLDPETPEIARPRLLKERLAHWLSATGGAAL